MVTQSEQDHLYLFNKPTVIFIKYTEYMLNTLIEHTRILIQYALNSAHAALPGMSDHWTIVFCINQTSPFQ